MVPESSLTALPGRVCVGTFVLTDDSLLFTTMSEARLDGAIKFVQERLGELAELRERTVTPFELELSRERHAAPERREPPPGLTVAKARDLERPLVNDHYSRWIDEPLETLGGRTPRQAAGSGGERARRARAAAARDREPCRAHAAQWHRMAGPALAASGAWDARRLARGIGAVVLATSADRRAGLSSADHPVRYVPKRWTTAAVHVTRH